MKTIKDLVGQPLKDAYEKAAQAAALMKKQALLDKEAGHEHVTPELARLSVELAAASQAFCEEFNRAEIEETKLDGDQIVEKIQLSLAGLNVPRREMAGEGMTPAVAHQYMDYLVSTPSRDRDVREIQKWNDTLIILDAIKREEKTQEYKGFPSLKTYSDPAFRPFLLRSDLRKAMDTATSGQGAEWVPTEWSAEMIEYVDLLANVINLHPVINIPRKLQTLKLPRKSAHLTAYHIPENTENAGAEIIGTEIGTANVAVTPKQIAAACVFSYELEEDSIFPIMDTIREDFAESLALGIEDAIINGSTSLTDLDNAAAIKLWTTPYDPRYMFDGYRKQVAGSTVATVDLGTLGFTFANLLTLKGNMGKYGVNPLMGAWVASPKGLMQIMGLSEVKTIDVFGPSATVVAGEIAKLAGSPVLCSGQVYDNLNASGVYDGVTTTKSVLLYVYRRGWVVGRKREFNVEVDRKIRQQQYEMVGTMRLAFVPRYASTEKVANVGYNF